MKYYHIKDAKMSLASQLLKHLVITRYCGVPWRESTYSRDAKGKPFWPPTGSGNTKIAFNVSHQAGLVSLIAAIGGDSEVEVGTDVVCADERLARDYQEIEKGGFFSWVDVYSDVFAESEVSFMKLAPVDVDVGEGVDLKGYGLSALSQCQWRNAKVEIEAEKGEKNSVTVDSNLVIDAKLRRFYAMWCLREAYVKMTGEALLAPWLKQLEILNVHAPSASEQTQEPKSLEKGQVVKDFWIHFKDKPVTDINIELTALGASYMVAGCARSAAGGRPFDLKMGDWKILDLESDVLQYGEVIS